ncbi:23S rRNA (adenine(1618)-N(6))-methyltransferase RlmF [Litorilituus lipolyticus]|uniref:Ribosomal RNA large subunit methyltransferase F n=1 Tax=Litorilituus lipolyticus TaxID=2491017 RepID=A0A502KXE1_9GAMM|nr:23S rRNA (adenine(1618)-N(6))-methyltransferase RlmF [Litorilituus lipolyticus]TPH12927.1 23S rRNA (adenine(1618)-N(6))-methyltransferase RlmF [Litorilituus lipolyticus]
MTKNNTHNKIVLHPKNKHNNGYDFIELCKSLPALKPLLINNKYNNQLTINFSDNKSVKTLNCALLKHQYNIDFWDIPEQNLCPAIPGRVDYIHYLNDLLQSSQLPTCFQARQVNVLDIGTGASCIYPILGYQVYGWEFIASDIDAQSLENVDNILKNNHKLTSHIHTRLQPKQSNIFNGVINQGDMFHMTLCNPPFHKSLKEANQGSLKKWRNLNSKKNYNQKENSAKLNFSGQKAELWCEGGELAFIRNMVKESKQFKNQVYWFTCLVSQKDNLFLIKQALKKAKVEQVKIIKMAQGNKVSRFIAWSYFPTS